MRNLVVAVVIGSSAVAGPGHSAATGGGGGFCAAFDAFITAIERLPDDETLTVLDAEQQAQLDSAIGDAGTALTELETSAPDDIAAEAARFADYFREIFAEIRSTDLGDASAVESLNELFAAEPPAEDLALLNDVFAYWSTECAGAVDEPSCLLTADEVGAITGTEIAETTTSGGGMTIGAIDLLAAPPTTIEETEAPPGVLQWSGCSYEAADGSEFEIGELTDAVGAPDPGQLERLAAVAVPAAVATPDVGDDAFVTSDGEVVVLTGDETLVFRVVFAELDSDQLGQLVDVAGEMLVDFQSAEERCAWLPLRAPDDWGPPSSDMLSGSGAAGDVTYESCRYRLAGLDDALLELTWSPGAARFEMLEQRRNTLPFVVDGVGDAAYEYRGTLFVRSGDHAIVIGAPEPVAVDLAVAAIEALAGTSS